METAVLSAFDYLINKTANRHKKHRGLVVDLPNHIVVESYIEAEARQSNKSHPVFVEVSAESPG
jgi:hypothetical protein